MTNVSPVSYTHLFTIALSPVLPPFSFSFGIKMSLASVRFSVTRKAYDLATSSAVSYTHLISSTKEVLNFSILKSDNQGKVANDVEASIQGSVITLPLDKYDDLKSFLIKFKKKDALRILSVE